MEMDSFREKLLALLKAMEIDISMEKVLALMNTYLEGQGLPETVSQCNEFGSDDWEDFIENAMAVENRREFERHFPKCLSCLRGLLDAYEIEKRILPFDSVHEESRHLNSAREKAREFLGARIQEDDIYLMAASERPGIGKAQGVTVDAGAQMGFLVNCIARVSPVGSEKGILRFNAEEITGFREGQTSYYFRPPFLFLATKLRELFRNNEFLTPFQLNRRHVMVEIEQIEDLGFIREAKSLALSAIVAILVGASPEDGNPDPYSNTVFSARVSQDGSLQPPVGDIRLKIETAQRSGKSEIILSETNRHDYLSMLEDYRKECREKPQISVHFFSHLGQALNYLGLTGIKPNETILFGSKIPSLKETKPIAAVSAIGSGRNRSVEEGWTALSVVAAKKGITEDVIWDFMETTEDLSQIRKEQKPLSTALIVGDTSRIARILPSSELKVNTQSSVSEMVDQLSEVATFVNGNTMGFVFDPRVAFTASIKQMLRRMEIWA